MQVDVRRLKQALWRGIQLLRQRRQQQQSAGSDAPDASPERQRQQVQLRFQDVVALLDENSGAGALRDLSVHLCCLLHLANEHGLVVRDAVDLRQLTISNIPAS